MSYFESLPNEIILEIGFRLDLYSLFNLCKVNRHFNSLLSQNNSFWRGRYLKDFGKPNCKVISWKEEYISEMPGDVYVFDNEWRTTPIRIFKLKARSVSTGWVHTLILDTKGNVWSFGENDCGQLGLPNKAYSHIPVQISLSSTDKLKAQAIAAGSYHSVILDIEGRVWTFGLNIKGQLGLGQADREKHPVPTQVPNLRAKLIAAGLSHTVVVDENSAIWVFGSNDNGQLGLPYPISLYNLRRVTPTLLPGLKAKAVFAGGNSTFVIDVEGAVWAFGSNINRQLGLEDKTCPWSLQPVKIGLEAKVISPSHYYTAVIASDDSVRTFGTIDQHLPNLKAKDVSVGKYHTLIINLEGKVQVLENSVQHNRLNPILLSGMKAKIVSAGNGHTVIVLGRQTGNKVFPESTRA